MKTIVVAALVGGLVAFLTMAFLGPKQTAPQFTTPHSSAFERVNSSHTLRCAYAAYDPFIIIGADGKITGIFHDVMEEAGKRLNLQIFWAEEVGYGNINTGFQTGRYDAFCAGLWPAGSRAAVTIFSRPVVWDPVSIWVRGDDTHFDGHPEVLNDPQYKIADIDGDATVSMADALFPKAARQTVSQNQTIGDEITQVTTRKADALFQDYMTADRYLSQTPGSLKDISPGKPPLIYPLTVGYNQHETALKGMVDVVLSDMERDGTIARIIKTYLGDKASLLYYQKNEFVPY